MKVAHSFIEINHECLLIIFPFALLLSLFWVLGERDFSLLARYTHRSILHISPTLLPPHSLYYNTSRVPNHYRLQSSRITKPPNGTVPFDSCDSCTPLNSSRKTIKNTCIQQNPGYLALPPCLLYTSPSPRD